MKHQPDNLPGPPAETARPSGNKNTILNGRILVLQAVILLGANLAYEAAGVCYTRFTGLTWDWHFIDLGPLRSSLLEGLFYMHIQPPVYNFYIGLLVQLLGDHAYMGLALGNLTLGFGAFAGGYYVMRRLGISTKVAMLLTGAFVVSPSFILLGHAAAYDFPVAALVIIAAAVAFRMLDTGRISTSLLFFSIIALLCGTRSMFHIVYLLAVILLLWIMRPDLRRVILTGSSVPLLFVFSIYAKNYVVFGKFTASSWMGMNAAKVLYRSTTPDVREQWYREGVVSDVFLVEPWSDLDMYPERFRTAGEFTDIEVLGRKRKASGYKNLNHVAYIALSDQYLKDVLSVIRTHPGAEAFGILAAWYCYFRATDESMFLPYIENVQPMVDFYDYVLYGKLPVHLMHGGKEYNIYLFLLLLLPLLFLFGVMLALGKGKTGRTLTGDQRIVIAFMCFTVLYVAVIVNAFELAENQRARFYTDLFSLVFLGIALETMLLPRLRKVLRRRG